MFLNVFQHARRFVDRKPWAAHLYVTDRCNLDCHYCNEFDNSRPHPPLPDLKRWMDKIRELGVLQLGLQGGEPLLHPEIVALVRHARDLGFAPISMATNGFPLSPDLLHQLGEAGLHAMNISVDRMTPIESTRKSLKTVEEKLDWFEDSPVRVNVSGVLSEDTLEEMGAVIDTCLKKGISVHARVIHDDLVAGRRLRSEASTLALLDFIEYEEQLKRRGERIHTNWAILEYQKRMLRQQPQDWTCVAGYKYFFVSAMGKFWPCSQVRTDRDIMTMTPEDLVAYDTKKDCQSGCGVYCTVDASLVLNNPAKYVGTEAVRRIESGISRLIGSHREPLVAPR